jgi:hypothetical protein
LKHLEAALPQTTADIRDDIEDAISCLDEIEQSPMFTMKEILSDA